MVPLTLALLLAVADDAARLEHFEKHVRPLLVARCVECHGPDEQSGGLRLDGPALRGDGGPAVVAGDADASELVKAIRYGDDGYRMPPDGKLAAAEIAILERWVADGAFWPPTDAAVADPVGNAFDLHARRAGHWCWRPVADPPVPTGGGDWPTSHVDRFVLARMGEAGLAPAADAEPRVWLRRVTFDLTGLPPTPEEIARFRADTSPQARDSPQARERVVDDLLARPAFGETWGRHWLDLVRYAESKGHEFDFPMPHAWKYRDWVVRAFNADLPYDAFVREHVAGDLVRPPRRDPATGGDESLLGTAFWSLGEEAMSPVDVKGAEANRIDNRIDVATKTFQGLTVACARCHDHKFDAISTRDYYGLYGILAGSRFAYAAIDDPQPRRDAIAAVENAKADLLPDLAAAYAEDANRIDRYLAAVRELHFGTPASADPTRLRPPRPLFDFESGGLDGWTTTGDAFAAGPFVPDEKVTGPQGRRLIASFGADPAAAFPGPDAATGTAVSPDFTIDRDRLSLLVAGGKAGRQVAVRLLVDGKAVHSVAGREEFALAGESWDVAEFHGRSARLKLIDRSVAGWGWIALDEVVLHDEDHPRHARPLAAVAAEFDVDPGRLAAWAAALDPQQRLPVGHPLADWQALAAGETPAPRAEEPVLEELSLRPLVSTVDAFAGGPAVAGDWLPSGDVAHPIGGLAYPGWHVSGRGGPRVQGVMQTADFVAQKPYLHVLARGRGARMTVVVEGLTLVRDPIYGGMKAKLDGAEAHWVTLDLRMVKGHRAYLEIADVTAADPADPFHENGWPADAQAAVGKAVFSDDAAPPPLPATAGLQPAGASPAPCGSAFRDRTVAALAAWPEGRLAAEDVPLLDWLLREGLLTAPGDILTTGRTALAAAVAAVPEPSLIGATVEGEGIDETVFVRGSHERRGEPAPRGYIEAVSGVPASPPLGSGRLALADALTADDNPLTDRVMVNRVWSHLFGQGLVATPDNFGVLGRPPTHPLLLDHLASRFREQGRSVKSLVRTLVLSRTYGLASRPGEHARAVDPDNRLMSHARVRRLPAEAVRDAMLAVSGRLEAKVGGPGVPVAASPFLTGRGARDFGPLDGAGRRSVYLAVRRNFLAPLLVGFDMPAPFSTVGRRGESTVPAQSLMLLNDPFVVRMAELWAKRTAAEASPEERIDRMFVAAYARPASEDEIETCLAFVAAGDWVDLAHALFNAKEFVYLR